MAVMILLNEEMAFMHFTYQMKEVAILCGDDEKYEEFVGEII
jgi:hypothetical protein